MRKGSKEMLKLKWQMLELLDKNLKTALMQLLQWNLQTCWKEMGKKKEEEKDMKNNPKEILKLKYSHTSVLINFKIYQTLSSVTLDEKKCFSTLFTFAGDLSHLLQLVWVTTPPARESASSVVTCLPLGTPFSWWNRGSHVSLTW